MSNWVRNASGLDPADCGGFSILYGDPAWKYGDSGVRGGTDHHYKTMTVAELCALPVLELAAPDACLFLWGTSPMLKEMITVGEAWGFKHKNKAFTWVKRYPVSGKVFFGQGHWTRGNPEDCWLWTRGKPEVKSHAVRQLLEAGPEVLDAVHTKHSAKPPEVRERIFQLLGAELPAIELFARERVPGWECWGNQVPGGETVSLKKVGI